MTLDSSVAARYVGLLLQMRQTTLVNVYEARTVIEPYCARLLAKRRTSADLEDLRQCIADLGGLVEAGPQAVPDPSLWTSLTYQFHVLIFERCGNQTLAVQCEVLADIVATHLHQSIAHGFTGDDAPASFRRTLRSYEKMVGFLEAKDAEGARPIGAHIWPRPARLSSRTSLVSARWWTSSTEPALSCARPRNPHRRLRPLLVRRGRSSCAQRDQRVPVRAFWFSCKAFRMSSAPRHS